MRGKPRRVPAGPTDVSPGNSKRFAPSSRKQPKPTGMDPSAPGYGTMNSGSAVNPMARGARIGGATTTSRNVPTGQSNLVSKAKRQVY
jgi:hypothetical protein